MSPRKQITTVGREVVRGTRKAEQLTQAGSDHPKVYERLQKLKQVVAFRKHKVGWSDIQSLVGIRRSTCYRWWRKLKDQGSKGLLAKPKRPKRSRRKAHWFSELLIQIEQLR